MAETDRGALVPAEGRIEEAAAAVEPARREAFAAFARALLARLGGEARASHAATVALLRDAFALAERRPPGAVCVRVHAPADRPGRTAIELVQDDRPFIVDTVRLFLRNHDLRERLLLHPILPVVRDAAGHLEAVGAGAASRDESVVVIEASPAVEDAERRAELEASLLEVMGKVRDVTDDHARMVRELRELSANLEYAARFLTDGPSRAAKICRFLGWLIDEHFVFTGFRRYEVRSVDGEPELAVAPGSGLGLFRDDATSRLARPGRGAAIPEELRDFLDDPRVILIDKSRVDSPVHRGGRLDRVALKEHDEAGRVVAIALVYGLFTFRALRTPASQIPLLAERLEQILAEDGAPPRSHRHKAFVAAFDAAPVEFLLGSDIQGVAELIREVVGSEGSHETRLVLRSDRRERSVYAAVMMPRERYGEALRQNLRDFLQERLGTRTMDDRTSFIEEGTAVLHFFCTAGSGRLTIPDEPVLEAEIAELCARWEDRFLDALRDRFGEAGAATLGARYEAAFPDALRLLTDPRDAVRDVEALEALYDGGRPRFTLYFDRRADRADVSTLKIYLPENRLLSELLPMVDHFGVKVVDAQQARVQPADRRAAFVLTLRVLPLGAEQDDLDLLGPRLGDAMGAVLGEAVGDDALNGLVLGAGLDWRQVDCIRAWVEYTMQIQGTLTRPFIRGVLLENPLAVRLLVQLHEARFDPALPEAERASREAWLRRAFEGYRDRLSSLNEDRAVSGLLVVLDAMLRTSFFAPPAEPHRIAFKIDPERIPDLPLPRPHREIFVHSQAMMGLHLRAGPVARGGLRWSDRPEDLRVEILGLMKTQTLKNGIIVPVGAKGGFVLKTSGLAPAEARRRADEQYRVFVASLLDLTDDVEPSGAVVPPQGVVRRDGDDPYLVVAADKGTAHLSDAANALALERDFWLGDAFASGGSEGYDHKKYGITARGAWECVLHHLAELGIEPDRDRYSVAGIGDMSGDVFGNGLLLMRRARLVAAFDHRHVFVDPDPDPKRSFEERQRLFGLPRSSWDDYDRARLSPGGGVYPRSARRVDLSPEARRRLGLGDGPLTGNDVVRAILALDVDLLWNGGIGTYVKASHESHADADDRANDAVRIDATALRARVVGEGGNLGFTQAARVEAALRGVRLDSDAIHNSAGVDLSDHEVNFKVLLAPLLRSGRIGPRERHDALFAVDEAACRAVLAHNRGQALALSLDEVRSRRDLASFALAADGLCAATGSDAAELGLPDADAVAERREAGLGLTRPELAVLLGLAKLATRQALARHPRVQAPDLAPLLESYFPPQLRESFPEALAGHRLRAEITALQLASGLIDAGGATLVPGLATQLGVDLSRAVVAAYLAEIVTEIPLHRGHLLDAAPELPRPLLYEALIELDQGVRAVARYLVKSGAETLDPVGLASLRDGLAELRAHADAFLSPGEAAELARRRDALMEQGLAEALASVVAAVPLADRGLNVVHIAQQAGVAPLDAARCYARLGDGSGLNWVYQRLAQAPRQDAWDRMMLAELRWELLDLQRELTQAVLARGGGDALGAAERFLASQEPLLDQVRELQRRALAGAGASALVVVTQRLRALRAAADLRGGAR